MTARPIRLARLRLAGAGLASFAFAVVACGEPRPSATATTAQSPLVTSAADSTQSAAPARNVGASREASQAADTSFRLSRVEELSTTSAAQSEFGRACARLLRNATDGREYMLRKSSVETKKKEDSTTITTQLTRAVGDYDVIGSSAAGSESRRLRVDCVTGRAVGWVDPGT